MGWYEAIKDLGSVAEKINHAEILEKLALLRMECAALAEENARLREENLKQAAQINAREDLQFKHNVYWRGDGDNREGPFCPKCLNDSGKVARMGDTLKDGWWRCVVCDLKVAPVDLK